MNYTQMGDLTRIFSARRDNFELKSRLNQLATELATGKVTDLPDHLHSDQTRLAYVDRELANLKSYNQTGKQTIAFLNAQQLSLDIIAEERENLRRTLLAATLEPTIDDIAIATEQGGRIFETMVSTLNQDFAGRTLFSGTETQTTPLPDADGILTALLGGLNLTQNAAQIADDIRDFFSDPAGGFAALYLGAPENPNIRPVNKDTDIDIGTTALNPRLASSLSSAAIAAIAMSPALSGDTERQASLLMESAATTTQASRDLSYLQGRIGASQHRAEQAMASNTAMLSSLQIEHTELVSADPYETASALHEVEQQLQTHYMLTGRLSKLSLMDYL